MATLRTEVPVGEEPQV